MAVGVSKTDSDRKIWGNLFVDIEDMGTLKLFENESMETVAASFILSELTLSDIVVVGPKADFPLFRVRVQDQGQELEFLIETVREQREFVHFLLRSSTENDTGNGTGNGI